MKDLSQYKIRAKVDVGVKMVVGTQDKGEVKCEILAIIGLDCAPINPIIGQPLM